MRWLITLPLTGAQIVARILTTTLVVLDSLFYIVGSSDSTKRLRFECDAQTTGKTLTLDTGAQTVDRTLTIPVLGGNRTIALIDQAQTITAALTVVDSFTVAGSSDQTKTLRFECDAQTANADLVIDTGAQTVDRTLTIPVLSGNRTLAVIDQAQTLTATNRFDAAEGIGLGVAPTAGNGRLQFASSTGQSGGMAFGTDTFLYRTTGGVLGIVASGTTYAGMSYNNGTVGFNALCNGTSNAFFQTSTAHQLLFGANNLVNLACNTDGTITVGSSDPGGSAQLRVNGSFFNNSSVLSSSPTGGVGYTTGAGGTVTQITSKSTSVTLNKICGQITMQAAALGAGAKVSFVVSNTSCAALDVPNVCVVSGGTANAYRASVTAVAANSFTVTVENITGGSLSESPVIGFSILKAVAS